MANTNVTMRIDETLKAQLQELMSNLGLEYDNFLYNGCKTGGKRTSVAI